MVTFIDIYIYIHVYIYILWYNYRLLYLFIRLVVEDVDLGEVPVTVGVRVRKDLVEGLVTVELAEVDLIMNLLLKMMMTMMKTGVKDIWNGILDVLSHFSRTCDVLDLHHH